MHDSFQILKLAEHSCVEYFYASIAIILHSSFSTIKALQPMSRYISLDSVYTVMFRYIFITIICTVDLFIQPLDSFARAYLICFFVSNKRIKY